MWRAGAGDIASGRNLGIIPIGKMANLGPTLPWRLDSKSKSSRHNLMGLNEKSILAYSLAPGSKTRDPELV